MRVDDRENGMGTGYRFAVGDLQLGELEQARTSRAVGKEQLPSLLVVIHPLGCRGIGTSNITTSLAYCVR